MNLLRNLTMNSLSFLYFTPPVADITRLAGNTEGLNKTLCKECFPSCNKIEYRIQASTLPLEVDPRIWTDENDQVASWYAAKRRAFKNLTISNIYDWN